jgi:hypothetical protein
MVFTKFVISAGIAEIQKPWMAVPEIVNRFLLHETPLGLFFTSLFLDSGNPCQDKE